MTVADLYHGWFYHHGALRLGSSMAWGIQLLREDARRMCLRAASDRLETAWNNIRSQPVHVPFGMHPAVADPALPSYVRDWFSHSDPGSYWSEQDVSTRIDRICIPALHIAGWYDTYLEGSIAGYLALRSGAGSEYARQNQYLIAGPWTHFPWGDRAGDTNFGEAANLGTDEILIRWFNHWLKDSGEFQTQPQINYFTLGANRWQTANAWPLATYPTYLSSAGNANSRKGGGRLVFKAPPAEEPRDIFVYDPAVPVQAPGGPQGLSGPHDQAVLEMGNNLLVYTSGPVNRATEIFGQPRIRLYAATSAAHADLTAKIVRVTTTDRAEFLSIGIARSSWLFRGSDYEADKVHLWEFTLEPLAFTLAPGDRLRLEIASSAFPLYDRNPSTNTLPHLADNWNWTRSTQQILHSAQCPSALYLPITGESGW